MNRRDFFSAFAPASVRFGVRAEPLAAFFIAPYCPSCGDPLLYPNGALQQTADVTVPMSCFCGWTGRSYVKRTQS